MLTAGAPTDQGPLLFIGFDPADLAHLRANQPLRVDGVQHGLPDVPLVLLFETDPMVTFWAAQTWAVVVLVRESTIAAMRAAADGFVAVSLEHPLLPAGTHAIFFTGDDDAALVAQMRATGLVSVDTPVTGDVVPADAPPVASAPPESARPVVRPAPRSSFVPGAAACAALASISLAATLFGAAKSVAAGLGLTILFAGLTGFLALAERSRRRDARAARRG